MPSRSAAVSRRAAKDELKILAAVDYESMETFGARRCAVKLSKGSGDWVRFDKDTCAQYAMCCWVAKNLTGPQIEFSTQTPDEHASSRRLSMVTSSTHAEAVASLSLISGSMSGVDLNVGAGVSTGGGLKDDSVSVKLLGCGVVVGRRIGISLFDNSIGELAPAALRHVQLVHTPQLAPPAAVVDLGKIAESARSPTPTRAAGAERDFCFSLTRSTETELDFSQEDGTARAEEHAAPADPNQAPVL